MKRIASLISLLALAATAVFAQGTAAPNQAASATADPYEDAATLANAPDIIFSNLGPSADNRYNPRAGLTLSGKSAFDDETETWGAVRFVPKVDVQARVLEAAIQYTRGAKLIILGLYGNDEASDSVGAPLPGGQGSTAQIPDDDSCCQLAKVTLAGEGVTLTAGTTYWLVAKSDDKNAPDFEGFWRVSNTGNSATIGPPSGWRSASGAWPAAQIRGTKLQTLHKADTAAGKTIIFSNIDHTAASPIFTNVGPLITAQSAVSYPEIWEALPFTPRADVHAKALAAAIAALGQDPDQRIYLSIYSDKAGVPGTLLPGGQGSTSDFPLTGECCDLAKVRLSGAGVALTGGIQYWLVASPDNVNDPYFEGIWRWSTEATGAYKEPKHLATWVISPGGWMAAEVTGTKP